MEALIHSLKMVPRGLWGAKGKTGHPLRWPVFLLNYIFPLMYLAKIWHKMHKNCSTIISGIGYPGSLLGKLNYYDSGTRRKIKG